MLILLEEEKQWDFVAPDISEDLWELPAVEVVVEDTGF